MEMTFNPSWTRSGSLVAHAMWRTLQRAVVAFMPPSGKQPSRNSPDVGINPATAR